MTRIVPFDCDDDADIEYNPNEAHSRDSYKGIAEL
jgi:hypothetical protein